MTVSRRSGALLAGIGGGALVVALVVAVGSGTGSFAGDSGRSLAGDPGNGRASDASASGVHATGLAVTDRGYTLRLASRTHPEDTATPFRFVVDGPDGRPVTDFTRTHDKDLHLVVVRRDASAYQHVHPTMDASGEWSIPLTVPEAGAYKVFADFAPAGTDGALTLAADVSVPGEYAPVPLPPPSTEAAVDGYEVRLDGELVAGSGSAVTLSVTRGGRPVADLEPYLAAYGHLVALRDGDLAYLHVHPEGDPAEVGSSGGPDVEFVVEVPTPGTYRLFLDFQHRGVVRTAEFTAAVPARSVGDAGSGEGSGHENHEGHGG